MTEPAYAMNQPNFAELYERSLVQPLFRPWAVVLLERARVMSGDRVLDVACGTGIVARLAKEHLGDTGRVVGLDLSPLMIGVARAVAPSIEWREGNAAALPLAPMETFDVVLCQQGLQFMPDKSAAAAEMRRALVPGGRLAVATWRPLQEIPCFLALHGVAERHIGPVVDQRHSFGDATALETLLVEAGFTDVRVETVSRPVHFADPAVFARMNAMALVGMSSASKTMNDEERVRAATAIATESAKTLEAFVDGEGVTFAISSNVATARG